ncbi:MAG: NDP-sugar synthase [Rubrobacter sp.]|nr:NDP-sugar synthase [Rubrobacter sp.]
MKAMVLAAGKGTRLFPLTGVIPKPMAPVAGKPIIQHIFEALSEAGVDEVHVNVHYLAHIILGCYGERSWVDGMTVVTTREDELMGTAGGVKRLADRFDETFIVIMGDALTDADVREVFTFHKEHGALATLVLKRVEDTSEYGVAKLDAEKNILGFQEKPQPEEAISNLANTGIYVLEPEVLEYIPKDTFFDFAEDVFPRLLKSGEKVVGYEGDFYWSDIGTLVSYRAAQHDALSGRVAVKVPGERWGKGLWIAEKARIHPSTYGRIEGYAVVGSKAVVGRGASLSGVVAVGDGCRVSDGATLKQSVLLPGSSVGSEAYLEDCIVGPGYEVRPREWIRGGALVRRAC